MTAEQIIFLVVGAVTLLSALMVVTARDLVHAALWLVATLFGVAVVYTLLNASFLAVVQVVVYIGAIAILFIFAVMLTRRQTSTDTGPSLNKNWWLGAILAVLTFVGLFSLFQGWSGFTKTASALPSGFDAVNELGTALTSPAGYVLPFEVASVLLLAALVGAVYLAFSKK
jgi:NADH-quinone oxidoreductase subunit J